MSAYDAPGAAVLTGPDTRIAIGAVRKIASDIHRQLGAERREGDVRTDTTDPKFFGNMCHKADCARPIGLNVLSFCSELTVWTCEQEVIRDEFLQGGQVRVQLCGSDAGLQQDNFRVCLADQDLCEGGGIHILHKRLPRMTKLTCAQPAPVGCGSMCKAVL